MDKSLELSEDFFKQGYCLGVKDDFWILYRGGKEIATFPQSIPRSIINSIINYYDGNETD